MQKFEFNVGRVFAPKQRSRVLEVCKDRKAVEAMAVNELVDLLVRA